ncbi:copper resistance protein NlpE N-terminal domain-containing protein [Hydrocarboniclastica marina]|nr:copper resistance protein NlpE N-terminal domain-containing protein [Hydrocarboniclastica marina]
MATSRSIGTSFAARLVSKAPVLLALLLTGFMTACSTMTGSGINSGSESEAYGIWTGQFPCTGCAAVDARLVLWRDPNLFRLTETFQRTGEPPKTFTSSGRWHIENVGKSPELGRLSLTTNDGQRTLYLERLPRGGLRLLDPNGEPVADEIGVLRRTRAQADQD